MVDLTYKCNNSNELECNINKLLLKKKATRCVVFGCGLLLDVLALAVVCY